MSASYTVKAVTSNHKGGKAPLHSGASRISPQHGRHLLPGNGIVGAEPAVAIACDHTCAVRPADRFPTPVLRFHIIVVHGTVCNRAAFQPPEDGDGDAGGDGDGHFSTQLCKGVGAVAIGSNLHRPSGGVCDRDLIYGITFVWSGRNGDWIPLFRALRTDGDGAMLRLFHAGRINRIRGIRRNGPHRRMGIPNGIGGEASDIQGQAGFIAVNGEVFAPLIFVGRPLFELLGLPLVHTVNTIAVLALQLAGQQDFQQDIGLGNAPSSPSTSSVTVLVRA